jgi:hypothetical protein
LQGCCAKPRELEPAAEVNELADEGDTEHSYQYICGNGRQRVFWLQMKEMQRCHREEECAYERSGHANPDNATPVHAEILAGKLEKRQE